MPAFFLPRISLVNFSNSLLCSIHSSKTVVCFKNKQVNGRKLRSLSVRAILEVFL